MSEKKKEEKHNNIHSFPSKIIFIIITIVLISAGVFGIKSQNILRNHKVFALDFLEPSSTPTPIPPTPTITVTPTVTLTPTPTPVPLVGYCLKVPVLFYHHVQPQAQAMQKKQTSVSVDSGIFDQQMQYLATHGYITISVKQLIDALISHSSLPAKSIAVTLDDGYEDAYDNAYPVFQKYHIIGNLMIATGLIGNGDYLSWDHVKEMVHSGSVYLTDHTWSHANVGGSNSDKIKYEIETCRQQLEQQTGQTADIFTYPYGTFGATAIAILRQDGFKAAFTTNPGFYQCDSFLFTLHRTRIGNAPLSAYGL